MLTECTVHGVPATGLLLLEPKDNSWRYFKHILETRCLPCILRREVRYIWWMIGTSCCVPARLFLGPEGCRDKWRWGDNTEWSGDYSYSFHPCYKRWPGFTAGGLAHTHSSNLPLCLRHIQARDYFLPAFQTIVKSFGDHPSRHVT